MKLGFLGSGLAEAGCSCRRRLATSPVCKVGDVISGVLLLLLLLLLAQSGERVSAAGRDGDGYLATSLPTRRAAVRAPSCLALLRGDGGGDGESDRA